MQRRRLELIGEEIRKVLGPNDATDGVSRFYYVWQTRWHSFDGTPIDPSQRPLIAGLERVRGEVERHWFQTKALKNYYWFPDLAAAVVVDSDKRTQKQTRKRFLDRLDEAVRHGLTRYEADHDELTGLWGRRAFERHCVSIIRTAAATGAEQDESARPRASNDLVLLTADLDHFKQINDSNGHQYGDLVLNCFARRLQSITRRFSEDNRVSMGLARTGGEEFSLFLAGALVREQLVRLAEEISGIGGSEGLPSETEWSELSTGYGCQGHPRLGRHGRHMTASVGVSSTASFAGALDAVALLSRLVREADQAMYRAKQGGRNVHRFYAEIRERHGAVLERHPDTAIVCIDVGQTVGVRTGDEFLVFHPEFAGQRPLAISDGRSERVVGIRPRVHSGRLVVFDVQDEIAHTRIAEESPSNVIQAGCLLEAVPLGTVSHLLDRAASVEGRAAADQAREAVQAALKAAKACYVVVGTLVAPEDLEHSWGVSEINGALARLYDSFVKGLGRTASIHRLDTWSYAAVVASDTHRDEISLGQMVTQQLGVHLGSQFRVAIGVAKGIGKFEDAPAWGRGLRKEDALEHALVAMQLCKKRGDELKVFAEATSNDLLYEARRRRDYQAGRSDYAKLREIGITEAAFYNQAGLCFVYGSNADHSAAEELFRLAITEDGKEGYYRANLASTLVSLGRAGEAADEFFEALQLRPELGAPYLFEAGKCLTISGEAMSDDERKRQGLELLRRVLAEDDTPERERNEASELLSRFAGDQPS